MERVIQVYRRSAGVIQVGYGPGEREARRHRQG